TKEGAGGAPSGFFPWFEAPGRRTAGVPIAFGHWSTLGLVNRSDLLALDTGCVWGGSLTAVRVDGGRREVFQVDCEQAQAPG
ncbi:MAG: bis(5'-nucleosyl)-tetraphosphatase (symmetrical), partial [Rubrivivax sp.]